MHHKIPLLTTEGFLPEIVQIHDATEWTDPRTFSLHDRYLQSFLSNTMGEKLFLNHQRKPLLQFLPAQDLSWFTDHAMRGFFQKHNFYVMQFPTTPAKEFALAAQSLYWLLMYLGAMELQERPIAEEAYGHLAHVCPQELLSATDDLVGIPLEHLFQSQPFQQLFHLPLEKRVDVELYDSHTTPITLLLDLREEFWTTGGL